MTGKVGRAVVIGASAGGLEALFTILPALPADYPLPIMIVMHLPADRKSLMPELLAAKCRMSVREVEDKDALAGGTIYLAPPDYHLLVEADGTLSLSNEEPVLYSRPSIDVLFESAADAYGPNLTGVILTGANSDGATGLKAVLAAGGKGLIQDPLLASSSAMPEAAARACPEAEILSLDQIAGSLQKAAAA